MFVRILVIIVIVIVIIECCEPNEMGYCLRDTTQPSIKECVGRQAINYLQNVVDSRNFTIISGFVIASDENLASRSINFLDQDPLDFRGILENAGIVLSQRSLEWKLSSIYPGLELRIGPSADTTSVLEFVMDPDHNNLDERNYLLEEPSSARIITKRFLLPVLLGLKFHLVTIVPIIFAGIVFLCKKAAFLAKIGLFISSILGFGGALGSLGIGAGQFAGGFDGGGPGFGGFGGLGPIHHGGGHLGGHGGLGLGAFAEPHQFDGYTRNGRKLQFERPREYLIDPEPVPDDKFYDYEKNVLMQDKNFQIFQKDDNNKFTITPVIGPQQKRDRVTFI